MCVGEEINHEESNENFEVRGTMRKTHWIGRKDVCWLFVVTVNEKEIDPEKDLYFRIQKGGGHW